MLDRLRLAAVKGTDWLGIAYVPSDVFIQW